MTEDDKKYRTSQTDAIHNGLKAIMLLADRIGHQDIADMVESAMSHFHAAIRAYNESSNNPGEKK